MILSILYFLWPYFIQVYAIFFVDFEQNRASLLFIPFVVPIHFESSRGKCYLLINDRDFRITVRHSLYPQLLKLLPRNILIKAPGPGIVGHAKIKIVKSILTSIILFI